MTEVFDDTVPVIDGLAVLSGNGNNGHHAPSDDSPLDGPRYPLTDTGNAERLIARFGQDLRYVKLWGHWLVWTGTHWATDQTSEVGQRVKITVRSIRDEAARIGDPDRRKATFTHAERSESGPRMREIVRVATDDKYLAVEPALFDRDPMLASAPNGTIDLRTGLLREHRRDDYSTKLLRVPYKEGARAPLWLACLDRWMDSNAGLIAFLQRAVGYSLTGSTGEEVMFFLYGHGRNGKSKFIHAVRHVMGDYAKSVRPEALMVKQGDGIPNEIAALVGARFVPTVEVDESARLAESLVKQLTGGDMVSARFMRAEFFEFRPAMKIWMAANHKPAIRGTDLAMWERILTIPFEVTIPAEERDKDLERKLEAEAEGILAWIVDGCLEWQRRGLDPPPEVMGATDEYRAEMDVLGQFLEECCTLGDDREVSNTQIYLRYTDWAKSTGVRHVWPAQTLSKKLRERGFDSYRTMNTRGWIGVSVNPSDMTA